MYVSASTSYKTSDAQLAMAKQLRLGGVRARPPRTPRHELLVTTSDGEVFPVLKPLLKPCIALTKAVRQKEEGDGPAEASVPVECATFDRVDFNKQAAGAKYIVTEGVTGVCSDVVGALLEHAGGWRGSCALEQLSRSWRDA